MSKSIFVTGTGTDVGKTYVSALIIKKLREAGLNAGYYKAAVSGNQTVNGQLIPGDAAYVKQIARLDAEPQEMVSYVYAKALAPHLAARLEGNPPLMTVIKAAFDRMQAQFDYLVVEGSGGILCPLRFDEQEIWLEDIIRELRLTSLIVADAGLGTINSAVLTYEYMRQKHLKVKGFIVNNFHPGSLMEEDNVKMIQYRTQIPLLACVQPGAEELACEAALLAGIFA